MKHALLALVVLITACASPRPVIYPDDHYKAAGGEEAAKADADLCLKDAKQYLKEHPAKKIGGKTVRGGFFGAFMGMVFGAFTGDYKRAVSEGAAVGAAGGMAHGVWEAGSPDEIQRAYTQRCLAEKGWSVIGWK